MTNLMNTKVRLVRCPGCRKVLPELPDVPVYQCGGCGKVLEAKNQKINVKDEGSCSSVSSLAQSNKVDYVCEDKDAGSLNQLETLPSSGESQLDESKENDQNGLRDCNTQHIASGEIASSSTELTFPENDQSSPESQAHLGLFEPSESYNRRDEDEFVDSNGEHSDSTNFTTVIPSSSELTSHEDEQSSPDFQACVGADEDECTLQQCIEGDENKYGDCINDCPEEINFSNEVSSSTELHLCVGKLPSARAVANTVANGIENSLEKNNGVGPNDLGVSGRESHMSTRISNEATSSTELVCKEIEHPSAIAGEVGGNLESHHTMKTADISSWTKLRDPVITAEKLSGDSLLLDHLTSHIELLEQSKKSSLQGFDRVSSVDTLENMPLVYPSSELGTGLRCMYRSPTAQSYYAYDGSVSSYDGSDDQESDRNCHVSKRSFKDGGFSSSKGNTRSNESKMQHGAVSSSILLGENHSTINGSKSPQNELPEIRRHGYSRRYRTSLESEGCVPVLPRYPIDFPVVRNNGWPSSYGPSDELHHHPSLHSHDEPGNPEPDGMELLQMVRELQDQLTQLRTQKGKEHEIFPTGVVRNEKLVPACNNDFPTTWEMHPDPKFSRFLGKYNQGKSCFHHCKISRAAFSGEAYHAEHQSDYSCLHCFPQTRNWSAQLPLHTPCCSKQHYTTQPTHSYHCPYHACTSSPQLFSSSGCSLWSHGASSDDQTRKDQEARKLYLKEKHLVKRHSRPMAGGAPIIACYHCSELLQLPADFLLFGRKFLHLRCSSCSKVLKFSLQNRTRLVPYNPGAMAPPPSEADEFSDAINKRNLVGAGAQANGGSLAEPVSCSDDYGRSIDRSCSTDGDPFCLPRRIAERNFNDRKMSSGGSFGPADDKKKGVLIESHSVGIFESAEPSSEMYQLKEPSSEIEELPAPSSSPLHRLMGYSSPSKVMLR